MDENTKKKITLIRDLIKKSNYKQALEEAQIVIYKNSKIFQVHLMAGLCYEKLEKPHEAEKEYKQVLDLKPGEPNALKALCDLYSKMGRVEQSTKFMEEMLTIQKVTEPLKYRQNLVKLVEMYQKRLDLEKIDVIFKELLQSQKELTEEFVTIANIYFKTAVENQCFFLQHFLPLGIKGEQYRTLQPGAKQKLNTLLVQIVQFLYSVKLACKMSNKDISSSIYEMKQCFPYASCFLMLFLMDQYIATQSAYNSVILQQIYLLLTAFYDKADNCYLHLETMEPECFVVSAVLAYEYLAFMKEFFMLDACFDPYFDRLGSEIESIQSRRVREDYRNKIDRFILKECRAVSKISETQNIENRLELLKYRVMKLDGSYLEEVVAKMAMSCFVNYQKLCDMRNLLKTRINNLQQGQIQPHLYKYYFDYLMKIAKLYKALDQELSIYDVIQYIHDHDKIDMKYLVEFSWIQVGKNSKQDKPEFVAIVNQQLNEIQQVLPKLTGSAKSQALRKITVLQIILDQNEGILDGFKLALGTERSFENLECIGFYYFIEGDFQRSLRYLKQAFVIRQNEYHLNRAIFVAMVKLNELKEAYSFLERIYEGFPNVYWINFALAMNSINNKKIQQAYKYLSGAFQAFVGGVSKSFKFSYQKTIEGKRYSLVYMIDQNDFHILEDHIVVPEQTIYSLLPMASSIFFNSNQQIKQIRLETQLGEILKILGRNKSSYNHLASAYMMLQALPKQIQNQNLLQVIATKKQFATMLFYVRAYKEAEQILRQALKVCLQIESKGKVAQNLLSMYQSEIHSLLFEVSVMRLDDMMKFQSYEAVGEYIQKFTTALQQMKASVKKPSLNYYKAKYQFYILCYLHNKKLGVEQSIQTIKEFLNYFGLEHSQIESDKFYNRLAQLTNEQKIIVKECLEDYYVLLYMKQNNLSTKQQEKIKAESVLPLIQIFPTSNVFYIVYGMAVTDTKLKIAAFLKCIQLDRQSPISVDLLASLFLKVKDYLTACKLFLKSLEIDLFNPKSYIGLCTCLYALIGFSIKRGATEDKQIIRKALNKINSYMMFLRISDPSENYHMLKFLRTLISDEPIPLFELKAGLEQSRKLAAHKYSQKLLFQLLEESTQYLKDFNTWKKQGQTQILEKYLANHQIECGDDLYGIGKSLMNRIEKQLIECELGNIKNGEIRLKRKCKFLNKMCIIGNIFIKSQKMNRPELDKFVEICELLEEIEELRDQQLIKLQKNTKDVLIKALIKSQNKAIDDTTTLINTINDLNISRVFKKVATFDHIQVYLNHFSQQKHLKPIKKYIIKSLHLFPCDQNLRKILVSWLLVVEKKNNKSVKKVKSIIDYRLEGALQMNIDDEANRSERFHKKCALMFNVQEPNAWIGFIDAQWAKKKQVKWSGHLLKLLKLHGDRENKLTVSSRQKAYKLLTEIAAEKMKNNQKIEVQSYPVQIRSQIALLADFYKLKESGHDKQLVGLFKKSNKNTQMSLAQYVIPYLVNKYENCNELEKLIDWCIDSSRSANEKGFYYLIKFISVCSKESTNEDALVDQLKKLLHIIMACQGSEGADTAVHENSFAVMKCMVALLSLNYEQLEQELSNAYGNRLVTYSDQVLINYFEVMKSYKEVETNHQGEGVFENFSYFVNCMIAMAKQPKLKGFFYSLKAMAQATVAQETSSKLSRELKMALLLDPVAGKSIVSKN